MFADDPAVAWSRSDIQTLWHQKSKPWWIQIGAGADDTILGQTAQLPRNICQDIDWIRYHQQNRIWTVVHQLRNDSLENVSIALHQIQTTFTRALTCASRNDAQARASRYGKIYFYRAQNRAC